MGDDGGVAESIEEIRTALDVAMSEAIPQGPVVLLGRPLHRNVGDQAIWVGQRRWLAEHGRPVVYASDWAALNWQRLHWAVCEDVTLLLHGGGNLGDVWPGEQKARERILNLYPGSVTVQLPQTVHFASVGAELRWRRVVDGHGSLTVMVRDQRSFDRASEWGCRVVLSPDPAFALTLRAPKPRRAEVVMLRTDAESAIDARAQDWVEVPYLPERVMRASAWLRARFGPWPHHWLAERWSERELRRGVRMLARGERVVTDRLHGHILALLLGRESVLLDNSYGKNRAFYDTWTAGLEHAEWAESSVS